LQTLTGT